MLKDGPGRGVSGGETNGWGSLFAWRVVVSVRVAGLATDDATGFTGALPVVGLAVGFPADSGTAVARTVETSALEVLKSSGNAK